MARRGTLARRSVAEWMIRGSLALALAILGYISVRNTLAYTLRGSDVGRAYALSVGDGRITALLGAGLSGPDATTADRTKADWLAHEALRQDATAVVAASTLGINAQIRNDTPGARRLFGYAEALSRRDLQTQIWALEDAVERNNIADALRHYDIALRTSRTAPSLLFPVLGAAIAEPAVRAGLTKTFMHRPNWSGLFVEYVSANGPDPHATMLLFRSLHRAGMPIAEVSQSLLINTLASHGAFDDAWSYYASVRDGTDPRRSRDPRFMVSTDSPTVFDWTPINDGGIVVSLQRGDTSGILDFSVPASVGGTLIQQMQMLSAGRYRFEGHGIGIDQPDRSRPYWLLKCRDGRELGRVAVPNSTQAGGVFVGQFDVPAGCPVQVLALIAVPSDAVAGTTGQIDRAAIYPYGGRQ